MIIRPATVEDWPRIWPFFARIVGAGETYAYPDDLTEETGRPLWMEVAPGQTVVAVAGDTILGSAKMGPNRPGRGSHIATASFMVDPAHQGRGTGAALGRHMVAWARAEGYHGVQFNAVVQTNITAVRLWQSLGFEIIGTVPEAFQSRAHGLVGLHVMFLPLRGQVPAAHQTDQESRSAGHAAATSVNGMDTSTMGIKTVLHPVSDLAAAKAVYAALLGVAPQTDGPYYVGFEAEGQHIGLVPGGGPQGMTSPVAYWHVPDIEAKLAEVTAAGATVKEPAHDVGGGRLVATVTDPDGNVLGLLQDR